MKDKLDFIQPIQVAPILGIIIIAFCLDVHVVMYSVMHIEVGHWDVSYRRMSLMIRIGV